ncbi:unnamed protein product [Rotaria magnacalcarata]|nr:unnamed protein product [Rotaria magnacalcarata]CAF3954989.1 unnamed protein product [Rotaria magnacalcarata]CAF3976718.1 unnamed protein product [Rotaria magnacalcarata]CAF4995015.1 unnamed protein product [Rotaria magnacalcarata]
MFVAYFTSDSSQNNYSKFLTHARHALRINETLYFHQYLNMGISLEGDRDCNLINRSLCYTTKKSLVVSFWRDSSRKKWLAKNIFKVFPGDHFTRVIMIHDKSNWFNFHNHEQLIWIHVNAQKRFWYMKRFITPEILSAYKYIWVLDDDVELLFDSLHYECVIAQLNVSFSSPGRLKGITSHAITRVNQDYANKIGRWTDFIEIGPIVVGTSSAWQCLWHYMSAFVGLGWGFDLVWCRLLAHKCSLNITMERSCAVLDIFGVDHLSEYIATTALGSQETPAYNEYYGNFHTKQVNIAPLANDINIYSSCKKIR